MAFARRGRAENRAPRRFLPRLLNSTVWFLFGGMTVAVLAAGVLYLRLSQGPVHVPSLADFAVKMFNQDSERFQARIGNAILTLGDSEAPSGLQFVDLEIQEKGGQTLFAIPRISARFDTKALVRGEVRPTEILLIQPQARLVRATDGKFQFGLGDPVDGPAKPAATTEDANTAQVAAIGRIFDGLAGDAPLTPELSLLREVRIARASFTYENAAIDRSWRTRGANLVLRRTGDGLTARMTLRLTDGAKTGAGVVLTAERKQGAKASNVTAKFTGLRPEHLAEQVDQMQWLSLFDAPLDGTLSASLTVDGVLQSLSGQIAAGAGRVLAIEDEGQPFDGMTLEFAYEPGLERMRIGGFDLASPAMDAEFAGFVDLRRDEDGLVTGLAGQFEVIDLDANVPKVFAEPISFAGGQIVAQLDLDTTRIDVASAFLRTGELVFDVSGAAWRNGDAWRTDLRAEGRNLSVAQLVQHWPIIAAPNPRAWVEKNIHSGSVDHVIAQMHLGGDEDQLSLDFRFSDLVASYLGEMSHIQRGDGQGSLTLDQFRLWVESGEVEPVEGLAIDLTGSDFLVRDIRNRPWPSVATIRAKGPTRAILALINEPPLGFLDKLRLRPDVVKGNAEVLAEVRLPLIKGLKLGDVEVGAKSQLSDLRLPFEIPGRVLDVAGKRVALDASKEALRFAGPVTINGKPVVLEWNEYFGRGAAERTIDLRGQATTELLADFDLTNDYYAGGEAPMTLRLTESGAADMTFDVDADLTPAVVMIPEFYWTKQPGTAGRLRADGILGETTKVSSFAVETADLVASGSAEFSGGKLRLANVERVQFKGLADLSIGAQRRSDNGYNLAVGGRRLDLALFDTPEGAGNGSDGPATPLDVTFEIGELVITPKAVAGLAIGTYSRDSAREAKANLEARLGGEVPFTADYTKPAGEPAEVEVVSEDGGTLLTTAGLFPGATGGRFRMRAKIEPEPGVELVGVARLRDVRIRGDGTFQSILDEGALDDAASAAKEEGLAFGKVKVPFELREDLIVLGDATAEGTLLTIKVEGTINEATDQIDLVGVISPLQALSKPIAQIPLLREILTGGKDEGIFAMTFQVEGTLDEPDFKVQPLSLLAPGILRKIFSGRTKKPNEKFIENLSRDDN